MGREIVYCATCGRQLAGADLDHAVRRDAQILCRDCAPAAPPPLPAVASRRPGSTSRLPKAGRRESTASWAVLGFAAAGAGALIVILLVLLPSSPDRPVPAPAPVDAPRPAPPKPERAREGILRDVARFADEACARDEFGKALGLWEAARARFDDPAWTAGVEEGRRDVRRRADARAEALLSSTAPDGREALAARVAAWGLADLTLDVQKRLKALAPPELKLSGLKVQSGKPYAWYEPRLGERIYIDREYVITALPEILRGARGLRTSNTDKTASGPGFIVFEADFPVTVYVSCDPRKKPPAWMAGWRPAGISLGMTDRALPLLAKDFPAGRIALGGSEAPKENALVVFVVARR